MAVPSSQPQHPATARWVSIVGARPQFIKLGPVCRAIEAHNRSAAAPRIEHRIIHTGQHYEPEVADLLFQQMRLPMPDHNLSVGSSSAGTQLARMIERLETALLAEKPDWVIIYGDTNSTLAGAIVAARLQLPLAHAEAGCRSGDMTMPEEQARIIADHLSRLLLAPSCSAMRNLEREGLGTPDDPVRRRTVMVGDVMYDALLQNLDLAEACALPTLYRLGLRRGQYYLLTLHRAENTDRVENLRAILEAVGSLGLPVLFPVHPRTRNVLAAAGISPGGNLLAVPPFGYFEILALQKHAKKILTDSGGVQKEAFYLSVPCITLRQTTEWSETVEAGANLIVGTGAQRIREAVAEQTQEWSQRATVYGNGDAAQKIVLALLAGGEIAPQEAAAFAGESVRAAAAASEAGN